MIAWWRTARRRDPVSFVPNLEASAAERERMRIAEAELRAIERDIARVRLDKPGPRGLRA
jgi:hypothetical protein